MNPSIHSDRLNRTPSVQAQPDQAFTLTELLVVVGTLAVLALLLVPALAGTKTDSWRVQCQNNLKQLQVGFSLFAQDHNEMFPPAGLQAGGGQLSWDSWIYSYISGGRSVTVSQAARGVYVVNTNDAAILGAAVGLPVVACPVDATLPKIDWMHVNGDPTAPLQFAPRTYAMNSPGSSWAVDIQVDPQNGKYPLPDLNQPGRHGVGIYWLGGSTLDWDAKGYKTSVVKDPGGTILLCEVASSMQMEGSIWPCCCCGPQTTDGAANGWGNLYQIDLATANYPAQQFESDGYNQGNQLYQAHWNRFNYLFHDGHVEALRIEDTVGTGPGNLNLKLAYPRGMWTVVPGD
jgi:prepilin-type processing-associated H-X9-DG protein